MPASSRVFHIPELLELIIEELEPSHLAVLARTARLFHVPAARHIWRRLNSKTLARLLALPPAVQHSSNVRCPDIVWGRFNLYASFVKSLALDVDSLRESEHTTLIRGSVSSPAYLLPDLRHLTIQTGSSGEQLWAALRLVCPSLESFTIDLDLIGENAGEAVRSQIAALIHAISRTCPRLKSFGLLGVSLGPLVVSAIEEVLRNADLVTFSCSWPGLEQSLIAALSLAAHLVKLQIRTDEPDSELEAELVDKTGLLSLPSRNGFAKLSSIDLQGLLDNITPFLSLLSPLPLSHIRVSVFQENIVDMDYLHLSQGLQAFHATLLELQIEIMETGFREDLSNGWSYLFPLFQCRLLRQFRICDYSSEAINVTDRHIADMAAAWPLLRVLKLDFGYKASPSERLQHIEALTLTALGSLAQVCQDLEEVYLDYLHADIIPPFPEPSRVSTHRMTRLGVGQAYIRAPHDVASYIGALWPGVSVTHSYNRIDQPDSEEMIREEMWDEVAWMIAVMDQDNAVL